MAEPARKPSKNQEYLDLRVRLHQRLIDEVNLSLIEELSREELRPELTQIVDRFLREETIAMKTTERGRGTESQQVRLSSARLNPRTRPARNASQGRLGLRYFGQHAL